LALSFVWQSTHVPFFAMGSWKADLIFVFIGAAAVFV
jgi:hypothetical protein